MGSRQKPFQTWILAIRCRSNGVFWLPVHRGPRRDVGAFTIRRGVDWDGEIVALIIGIVLNFAPAASTQISCRNCRAHAFQLPKSTPSNTNLSITKLSFPHIKFATPEHISTRLLRWYERGPALGWSRSFPRAESKSSKWLLSYSPVVSIELTCFQVLEHFALEPMLCNPSKSVYAPNTRRFPNPVRSTH